MAVVMCLKVLYHFESANGKKSSPEQSDLVQVATADYNAIKAVLNSNGRLQGGTLVIDAVQNMMAMGCLA